MQSVTKGDLPAFMLRGAEVKRMIEGHEVVMDAVISSSDRIRPELKKPQMPKPKADEVKREMAELAGKRKIEIAKRATKRNKHN
eukprot:jgi/Tetstr1/461403/TSEL_006515.t1